MTERYVMTSRSEEIQKSIYKLELGDVLILGTDDLIERVPGGWIYFYTGHGVFVPYNDEFLQKEKKTV